MRRGDLRDTPQRWLARATPRSGYNFSRKSWLVHVTRWSPTYAIRWASSWSSCAGNSTRLSPHMAGPSHHSSSAGADRNRGGGAGVSGRGMQPGCPFQRRTGRRGDISAHDAHGVYSGTSGRPTACANCTISSVARGSLRGELALYSASHDFENGHWMSRRGRRARWRENAGRSFRASARSTWRVDVRPRNRRLLAGRGAGCFRTRPIVLKIVNSESSDFEQDFPDPVNALAVFLFVACTP